MVYFLRRDFLRSVKIGTLFAIAALVAYWLEKDVPTGRIPMLAMGSLVAFIALVVLGRAVAWLVYSGTRKDRDAASVYEDFLRDTNVWKRK